MRCSDRIHFDCGHDDFDTAPEPGEYLSSHWNLGSPLNRFIDLGPRPHGAPAPADTGAAPETRAVRLWRGKAKRGTAAGPGGWRHYWIKVPSRRRALRIRLRDRGCKGGSCEANLDLYVRRRARPTEDSFARAASRPGSNERARLPHPGRGQWFVGVRTVSGAEGHRFKITATY